MKTFFKKIHSLFKPIDLTKNKPYKQLLIFMIPILLSLIFQQVYTISDAAIVGKYLSAPEVSGVNVVYSLIFIVLQFAFGCASGFSVITSNKTGEKDEEGIRKSFATQLLLSLIISIILTIIAISLIPFLLNYIDLKPTDEDYQYAEIYLFIIYLGLFTQVFYNLMVSVLRSIGDSLTPLLFLIGSTVLNIGLDFLCILVFKWGVAGAALATIFAQFVAFISCFIYSLIKYPFFRVKLSDFKLTKIRTIEHLKLGLPLAFQFSILAIGLIVLEKAMVKIDTGTSISTSKEIFDCKLAYGTAIKFNDFLMCPLSALGTACLSYAGQNYGAKNISRLKEGLKDSLLLMLTFYVILLIIGVSLSINGLYTNIFLSSSNNNERIKYYASTYMYIDSSLYFILGFLFIGRNYLQGLGKSLYPFLAGVGGLIARVLCAKFMPLIIDPLTPYSDKVFVAICFSDPLAWLFSIIVLSVGIYIYLIKGKIYKELAFQERQTFIINK